MMCRYQKQPSNTNRSAEASKMKKPTRTSNNDSSMHAYKQGSTMHKQRLIPVDIPGEPKPVLLPPTLASALKMIIVSGLAGIDTFELNANGICCVRSTMYRLRQRGFPVVTNRYPAIDNDGNIHLNIGFYSLVKGPISKPQSQPPATPIVRTHMRIFGSILSSLKGIIQ